MLTKVMKYISIAVLLLAVFWRSSTNYELALQFVICASALLVSWEAYRSAKYFWSIGFVAIASVFNPIQPLAFSHALFLWLDLAAVAAFLLSLALLRAKPRLSLGSLIARDRGIQSM